MLLCDFARACCETLTILVCPLEDEPIPGRLRHAWISEMFPSCPVKWCPEDLPQLPKDLPDFWTIWRDVVARYAGEVDSVSAGEPYGRQLAAAVGATFVPQDRNEGGKAISGTAIRENPFGCWADIPPAVRLHYVKRVCVCGPESAGKTHLARGLADAFQTICVPEHGRLYTEKFGVDLDVEDLVRIGRGQQVASVAARRQANRIQIEDTDALLTAVWAEMLLGRSQPPLDEFDALADLYLLCDIDVPWVDDGTRYFPQRADRERFAELCVRALEAKDAPHVMVRGSWDERQCAAEGAILDAFPALTSQGV